jgi:5'-3' exonuclease
VLICFFLGNDFVPKSPTFAGPKTLEKMLEVYKLSFKEYLVGETGKINWMNLRKYLTFCSDLEMNEINI